MVVTRPRHQDMHDICARHVRVRKRFLRCECSQRDRVPCAALLEERNARKDGGFGRNAK
jgi:hypothetical protein